jgi:hypothetical protein
MQEDSFDEIGEMLKKEIRNQNNQNLDIYSKVLKLIPEEEKEEIVEAKTKIYKFPE